MNESLIIVEIGRFPNGPPSYQIFERLSNGTWRLAQKLVDGKANDPMYFRDARTRMADMNRVKAYGGSDEEDE